MYLEHFGLRDYPFMFIPDTDRFFAGGGREELLNKLQGALLAGEGLIQVSGATGSGKTMLCRTLCQRVAGHTQTALLLNPNLPPEDLIPAILLEFRLPLPESRQERLTARQTLLNHLVQLYRRGERALLLIDDVHCMPLETLEELLLLGNLETGRAKLLPMVLFTRPLLNDPNRQLKERLSSHIFLGPLSAQETESYLHARLLSAGFQGERLFTRLAARCLHYASGGGMHRINRLAHGALQRAMADSSRLVTVGHAIQVVLADLSPS
ncbi:MAG: ExeA family protein, partial [Alphaproteobacteria bacterium]